MASPCHPAPTPHPAGHAVRGPTPRPAATVGAMDTPVVLLDIDGTLVDSTYHHAIAWHRAFGAHHVEVPLWRIHRTIGMGGDKLVAEVAGDAVEAAHGDDLRARWEEKYAALLDEVSPLPGARDLVLDLHQRGLVVVLASSGAERFSHEAVRLLDVGDEVAAVTSSSDAEESKPDADILAVALDRVSGERADRRRGHAVRRRGGRPDRAGVRGGADRWLRPGRSARGGRCRPGGRGGGGPRRARLGPLLRTARR